MHYTIHVKQLIFMKFNVWLITRLSFVFVLFIIVYLLFLIPFILILALFCLLSLF